MEASEGTDELPEIGMHLPIEPWVAAYLRQRLLDQGSAASADMTLRPALQTLQVSAPNIASQESCIGCKALERIQLMLASLTLCEQGFLLVSAWYA